MIKTALKANPVNQITFFNKIVMVNRKLKGKPKILIRFTAKWLKINKLHNSKLSKL